MRVSLSVLGRQPPFQSAPVRSVAEAPWPPEAPLSSLLPRVTFAFSKPGSLQSDTGRMRKREKQREEERRPVTSPSLPASPDSCPSSSDYGVQGGKPTSERPKTPALGMYKPDAASPAPPKRCTGPLTVTPSQSVRTSKSDPRQPLHLARLFRPDTKPGNQGGSRIRTLSKPCPRPAHQALPRQAPPRQVPGISSSPSPALPPTSPALGPMTRPRPNKPHPDKPRPTKVPPK